MDAESRFGLVSEVGEEILTPEDLKELLKEKKEFIAYDGFEPSGRIHIAQGILRAININKMIKAGAKFKMLVADWHGWANNKMGGDLSKIQTVGKYFIEVWKASGMNLKKVEFVWVSDYVKDDSYWKIVMNVARTNTVQRIIRCSQIMGRSESDSLNASQIFYPCMQAADIFYLKADVCQLGMDQRKVNVLAREIAPKLGFKKPIVVSHHMLMGLSEPPKEDADSAERAIAMKMSKSNPNSAIFMTDSKEEIAAKLKKAYCPEKQSKDNPVLEYFRYILFQKHHLTGEDSTSITIERPEKFGGNATYDDYDTLEKDYVAGKIHPLDLKNTAVKIIDGLLQPVRDHFEKDKKAKELKKQVEGFEVTR